MTEYFEIFLNAVFIGLGTGTGIAISTYLANKALIQNIERIVDAVKNNKEVVENDEKKTV